MPCNVLAQHQWDNLVIGYHGLLNVGGPKVKVDSIPATDGYNAVSDPQTGQLLFTCGNFVQDRRAFYMPGGSLSPGGGQWVCPVPGDDSAWFLFEHYYHTSYAKVDMRQDSGFGAVMLRNANFAYDYTGGLVIVPAADHFHYWLIQPQATFPPGPSNFESFLIGPDGPIGPPVISPVSTVRWFYGTLLESSPDGRTITDGDAVYHVNQASGRVTMIRNITDNFHRNITYVSTMAFSPTDRFLYFGASSSTSDWPYYLVQYDTWGLDSEYIVAGPDTGGYELAFAGDGRIYVGGSPYYGAITSPDSAGAACHYVDTFVYVGDLGESIYNGVAKVVRSSATQISAVSVPSCQSSCYSFSRQDGAGFPKWTFDGGSPATATGAYIPQVCFSTAGAHEVQAITSTGDTLMTLVAAGVTAGSTRPLAPATATVTPGSSYTLPVQLLLGYSSPNDTIGHLMQDYVIDFDTNILTLPTNASQAISLPPQDEIVSARQSGGTLKLVIEDTLAKSWWDINTFSWRDTMDNVSIKFQVTNSDNWHSTPVTLALFSIDDGYGTRNDFCPEENNLLATITNASAGMAEGPYGESLVTVSPNPTPGPITITGAEAGRVEVENVLGERVSVPGPRSPEPGPRTLDLSKMPSGTYFVRVGTSVQPVIVSH